MAFRQLYYTSCERGVGGYAGFQFNALSEGVGARVMREVEQLTVYELPSWEWERKPASAPVNLCHVRDAVRGDAITARVVYAGADYSGRAGNYFAHALVTGDPERDFGGLLPAELWESPVWAHTEADSAVLPVLTDPLPRGSLDRPAVAAFLDARDDAEILLARLLSAVDKAIDGGRPLILWNRTSADNARWIAAISYLLEGARARDMSFCTYIRRPAQCRAHVIGTVPGVVTTPAAVAESFRVFDMTTGAMPDIKTHPLADLLARVGVLRAAGLWRQAAMLAAGAERSFDDWYPVAAAAAALLGVGPLPPAAASAIADWLPRAALRQAPLASPHIETVLTVLLDRHAELSDDQLRALAQAAKAGGAIGQLRRIETALLDRAITQLERGRPPPGPTPLITAEGSELAVALCERLLRSADPGMILTVLDWAAETGLNPDPRLVERCGRAVIGPALAALRDDRRIIRAGQAYPALARGLADCLAASGPDAALSLLGGVAGELLDRSDLSRYPELRTMLLLEEVRAGRLPPVAALREVIELRPPSATPPLSDKSLLAALWPRGLRTAGEAAQLLELANGDLRGTPVLKLLDAALQLPSGTSDLDAWLGLCDQALAHPVHRQLPPATQDRLEAVRGLGGALGGARHALARGDMHWYEDLHNRIEELPKGIRGPMRRCLADLTLAAPRPAAQLARCSPPVFDMACARARARLEATPPDHRLAARMFRSLGELHDSHPPRSQWLEEAVLVPTIARWPRKDQVRVAVILKHPVRLGPQIRRGSRVPGRLQVPGGLLGRLVTPGSRGSVSSSQRTADLSEDFRLWCKDHAGESAPGAGAGGGAGGGADSVTAWIRGLRRPGPR